MLVVWHAFFEEDEIVLSTVLSFGSLGRGCDVFEHSARNIDVVLYFVSDCVDYGLLGLFFGCLSLRLLHVTELIHHIYHLSQQLRLHFFAFVEFC